MGSIPAPCLCSSLQRFPDDFRAYLAKGLLLKDQGREGDATRYFIQVGRQVLHADSRAATRHAYCGSWAVPTTCSNYLCNHVLLPNVALTLILMMQAKFYAKGGNRKIVESIIESRQ